MGKKTKLQLQVYYGEGKGKTTAALGQALRAWGKGWSILFVQFLKEAGATSGEIGAAQKLGREWRLLRASLPCPVLRPPRRGEKALLKKETGVLLERALGEAASGRYDAVVFDEVLAAWKLGLLKVDDLRRVITASRASGVRLLVFTGRWAPKSILTSADLVTEMRKVKHPYDRGGKALAGIDY